MLKVFPLSDPVLSMIPVVQPCNKDQYTGTQVQKLGSQALGSNPDCLDSLRMEWNGYALKEDNT